MATMQCIRWIRRAMQNEGHFAFYIDAFHNNVQSTVYTRYALDHSIRYDTIRCDAIAATAQQNIEYPNSVQAQAIAVTATAAQTAQSHEFLSMCTIHCRIYIEEYRAEVCGNLMLHRSEIESQYFPFTHKIQCLCSQRFCKHTISLLQTLHRYKRFGLFAALSV